MVFTLHRYIFRDLLKSFALAALILSVVLGLGMMLRPLRDFSVNPAQVPLLILYTLPITLTMVIPIAALLSATLIYGRLAVENEINACRSSGISLLTLLYPALTLALLVGMASLLLGFHVIPDFIVKFEKIIKDDAEAIIYRNIEKKGNLGDLFPNIQVHADTADPENHRLMGVAVVMLNRKSKEIEAIMTAREVYIDFQRGQGEDQVLLNLREAKSVLKDGVVNVGKFEIIRPIPRLLRDDIKFKKLDELKRIQVDMTQFNPIREMLQNIQNQLTVERFFEWCQEKLSQQGYIDLRYSDQEYVRVYAEHCRRMKGKGKRKKAELIEKGGSSIKVSYYYGSDPSRQEVLPDKKYQAQQAILKVETRFRQPTVRVILEEVEWSYAGLNNPNRSRLIRYGWAGNALPAEVMIPLTLEQVRKNVIPLKQAKPSEFLKDDYKYLQKECNSLKVEIMAAKHSRLAFGVSCVVLVLMGAALGIIFRSGHLLTAFGISFIPAALCLITIFTGKHIAEQADQGVGAGLIFLWSGIVIVGGANVVVYRALLKR